MKKQISNAVYGLLDTAYPLGTLAIVPVALRSLGNDRFGIWMIAVSAISTGAIVASGFGDANIRIVAMHRASGNHQKVIRAVRSTMGIRCPGLRDSDCGVASYAHRDNAPGEEPSGTQAISVESARGLPAHSDRSIESAA